MVDWHDPAIVAAEDYALIKATHVMAGVYIWEFISCFGFEYSVFTKKRRFTWSFLLYLGCRWCPLVAMISLAVTFDLSDKSNCQAWVILSFVSGGLSFIFASALIVLRVAVLWDRNKIVMAFACAVWLANTATYGYSWSVLHSAWTGSSCIISHTITGRINVLSTMTTDTILLVLMLTGLMRWKNAPKSWGIWRILRIQGLVCVVVITLAGLPSTVFTFLNLNDPMNVIFEILALVLSALGATRLYRGLVESPGCSAKHNTEAVSHLPLHQPRHDAEATLDIEQDGHDVLSGSPRRVNF